MNKKTVETERRRDKTLHNNIHPRTTRNSTRIMRPIPINQNCMCTRPFYLTENAECVEKCVFAVDVSTIPLSASILENKSTNNDDDDDELHRDDEEREDGTVEFPPPPPPPSLLPPLAPS